MPFRSGERTPSTPARTGLPQNSEAVHATGSAIRFRIARLVSGAVMNRCLLVVAFLIVSPVLAGEAYPSPPDARVADKTQEEW